MNKTFTRRVAASLAAVAGTAAIAVGGAGAAQASQYSTVTLAPGAGHCVSQYASYQVRGDGSATNGGAKFKLLRNGSVIENTPSRVNGWATERRSAWGNFPGPGTYSICANNTGTQNTIVTLYLRTDGEF